MAQTVGQHAVSAFSGPVNQTSPIDANTVRGNDNALRVGYVDHDADPGIHLQSSAIASRPAAGTVGRKWLTADTGSYLLFFDTGTAWQELSYLRSDAGGTVTGNVTVTGALTVTGAVTGGSFVGPLTGNASTATALQTARAINGVNFDGTADVTVTAAAGTLTGATLAAGVTASSLTSVGTLSSLVVGGNVGIGIGAPAYKLVVSNAGANGLEVDPTASAGATTDLRSYDRSSAAYTPLATFASSHSWHIGSAEHARLTSGGYFKASNDGTYVGATGPYHEVRSSTAGNNTLLLTHTGAVPYGTSTAFLGADPNNITSYFERYAGIAASVETVRAYLYSNGTWNTATGIYGRLDDPNTYFELAGTDVARIVTGGTTRLTVGATGLATFANDVTVSGTVTAGAFSGPLTGNASTATALQTARTLWGQGFDGTANVTGALSAVTDIAMTGSLTGAAGVSATTLTGTLATAAQPNVTSVGTLTSLTVSGTVTAGNLTTSGALVLDPAGTGSAEDKYTRTANVSSATTIYTETAASPDFSVVMVYGESGSDRFVDFVGTVTGGPGPTVVISSTTVGGSPATRTYSKSTTNLQLAMSAGLYNIGVRSFAFDI